MDSSKQEVDSAAHRLLNRCVQLEESKRKVEASMSRSAASSSTTDEALSSTEYRQQLDQIRRALLTTQENARLKQDKLEEELRWLRNELGSLRDDQRTRAVVEKELLRERDALKENLSNAMAWAEKAHQHVVRVNAENVKYKKLVLALSGGAAGGDGAAGGAGAAGAGDHPNGTKTPTNLDGPKRGLVEEHKRSHDDTPVSSAAGESPMEDNAVPRRTMLGAKERSTRSLLKDWGSSLISNRRLLIRPIADDD